MNVVAGLLLVVGAAAIIGGVISWVEIEMDERRWRRRLKEEDDRMRIRQARYGHRDGAQ